MSKYYVHCKEKARSSPIANTLSAIGQEGKLMGSSGSGNISDYPGSSKGRKSSSGGSGGGGQPEDRCGRAFSVSLEDIERCDYFKAHGSVPPVGMPLHIAFKKRVVAETDKGETVGNLPTSYNYLAACLKDGWTYPGKVVASGSRGGVASVSADFAATSPR